MTTPTARAAAARNLEREEWANVLTHGTGAALAVGGAVWGLVAALGHGDPWRIASVSVFGLTLVLLYVASTLYHSARCPRKKRGLRILDHIGVYLLIAGSYTPFTLVTLRETVGWPLFGVVWGLALTGTAFEALWLDRPRWLSALVYLGLGWLVVFAGGPLAAALPPHGLALLVAGGLSYSLGTVFYVAKRLPYGHAVWHLFVLGGSACHTAAVVLHVVG